MGSTLSVLPRSLSNSTSIQLSSSANETQVIAIQGGLAEAAAIAHLLIPPLTSLGISQKDGALVPLNNLRISASSHEKTYSGASSYPEVLSQQFIVARIFSFLSEELIVDGADALALTKKAALYTIPTIDAPVGSPIPVAVYVRSQKNWIPSLNGRVLKILRIEDGEARFDINGDDVEDGAMDLQNLGITQDEARSIASIYPDAFEKIIWRVSTDKLSDLTLAWPSDLTPAQ